MENVTKCWRFRSSKYVQSSVVNVEDYLHKRGEKLPKTKSPWPSTYRPEVDVSPELGACIFSIIDWCYMVDFRTWSCRPRNGNFGYSINDGPSLVKFVSRSCFKCLPFWRTSIMLLWSLTQLNMISMSHNLK